MMYPLPVHTMLLFTQPVLILLNGGIDTSKHSGVITLVHQHFVKSGKLSKEQGRNLNWLFELRSVGDYGVSLHVGLDDARRAVVTRFHASVDQVRRAVHPQ